MVRFIILSLFFTSFAYADIEKRRMVESYTKSVESGEAPLGDATDYRMLLDKQEVDPDISLMFMFNYHMFREASKFEELPDDQYNATDILLAPSLFFNQVQKSLAAGVLKDPCINKFGEIKLDPFCQAAAKAAYFRQKINHLDEWKAKHGQ